MTSENAESKRYSSATMAQRHKDILSAARRMLAEGEGDIRMRELAERSGVALGTLYNRFGSKDALAAEAVMAVFRDRLLAWENTRGPTAVERMVERVESSVKEILRRPAFARKMVSIYFAGSRANGIARILHDLPLAEMNKAVAAMVREGVLGPDIDAQMLAEELLIAQYAIIARWAAGDIPDDKLNSRLDNMLRTHLKGAASGREQDRRP